MPYLKLQTNSNIENRKALMKNITALLMKELEKPEKFIMVALEPVTDMLFSGSTDPAAFVELKSIGLPPEKTSGLSAAICTLLNKKLSLPADRIYIEFTDSPGDMFGWNKGTFKK